MWGHLIRCVWASRGQINAVGRCSSGFIAGLFAVDVRNVKRARARLLPSTTEPASVLVSSARREASRRRSTSSSLRLYTCCCSVLNSCVARTASSWAALEEITNWSATARANSRARIGARSPIVTSKMSPRRRRTVIASRRKSTRKASTMSSGRIPGIVRAFASAHARVAASSRAPVEVITLRRNRLLWTCSRMTSAWCAATSPGTIPPSAPGSDWARSRISRVVLK